jgi:hypothetical protein
MFEASVDGEAYDMDRWGQYFKPAGMSQATGDPNKAAPTPATRVAAPVHMEDDDAPFDTTPAASTPAPAVSSASGETASRAQDILAMIRNRSKSE